MADKYVPNAGASFFSTDTSFEVQRSNHYEIEIDLQNLGLSEVNQKYIRLCCTSASIPSITVNAQQLRHGNETINVAGSPSYGEISISVYDVIGQDMAGLLQQWFWKVFNPQTSLMGLVVNYKTVAHIYQYSPDASVIREWVALGVFPTSLEFGTPSADGQGQPVTISMRLAVDKAYEKMVGTMPEVQSAIGNLYTNF